MTVQRVYHLPLLVWLILALSGCGVDKNIPVASVLSSGRITVSWNDVPGAAAYDLYLATSPGVTVINSFKISNVSTPTTLTDLEPGTTYYFFVMVYSDSGESRRSKEVAYTVTREEGTIELGDLLEESETLAESQSDAETPAAAPIADQTTNQKPGPRTDQSVGKSTEPAAAAKQTASAAALTSVAAAKPSAPDRQDVTLAWDDVPNATSYNIYWSENKGVTIKNGNKIPNVTNPYKMKNLIKGKQYYFIVTSVNATGESAASDELPVKVGGAN